MFDSALTEVGSTGGHLFQTAEISQNSEDKVMWG